MPALREVTASVVKHSISSWEDVNSHLPFTALKAGPVLLGLFRGPVLLNLLMNQFPERSISVMVQIETFNLSPDFGILSFQLRIFLLQLVNQPNFFVVVSAFAHISSAQSWFLLGFLTSPVGYRRHSRRPLILRHEAVLISRSEPSIESVQLPINEFHTHSKCWIFLSALENTVPFLVF